MNKNPILNNYGWNSERELAWHQMLQTQINAAALVPARIVLDHGERLMVIEPQGEAWLQRPSEAQCKETLAVGDWLAVSRDAFTANQVHFHELLPRTAKFSRSAAGTKVMEQILATNIDTVFLVQSLNHDFNLKRLERYLIAAWESGAKPVVVLTKSDLCTDELQLNRKLGQVREVALGVDCIPVSALNRTGLEALDPYMQPGQTIVLLGSSGVGKSTLVNTLLGEDLLATQEIRGDDSKGRHTTTHRELVLLENGALLVDTPGMRSLSLWEADYGIMQVFGDVEALMASCQYSNCDHKRTDGCAVQKALKSGQLSEIHYENWIKLQKEQRILANKLIRKEKNLERQQDQWKQKKPQRSQALRNALYEYSSLE